jgi:hypothetical protein
VVAEQAPSKEARMSEPRALEPRRLTTPRSAAAAGVVFAVLFTASILLTRAYGVVESSARPAGFLGQLSGGGFVALYLVPFAGISFLWFIGVVRDLIGIREDKFFATVFLGSGILFVAMLFSAAAVLVALQATEASALPGADFARAFARAELYVYGARTAGVFTFVTSMIVWRTGATSRWLALTGFAIGLTLFLTISFFDLVLLLFPAWVALVSVVRLRTATSASDAAD